MKKKFIYIVLIFLCISENSKSCFFNKANSKSYVVFQKTYHIPLEVYIFAEAYKSLQVDTYILENSVICTLENMDLKKESKLLQAQQNGLVRPLEPLTKQLHIIDYAIEDAKQPDIISANHLPHFTKVRLQHLLFSRK